MLRLLRDRTGLFFVFVLPIVLIVVLGTVYGGRVAPRLGIVAVDSGALGAELVDAIRNGAVKLELREPATVEALAGRRRGGHARDRASIVPRRLRRDAAGRRRGGGRHPRPAPERRLGPARGRRARRSPRRRPWSGPPASPRAARGSRSTRRWPRRAPSRAATAGRRRRRRADRRGDLPGRHGGLRARRPEPARPVHVPDLDDGGHAAHPHPPARRLAADARHADPGADDPRRRDAGPVRRGDAPGPLHRPALGARRSAWAGATRWRRRRSSSSSRSSAPGRRCSSASSRTTRTRPARWASWPGCCWAPWAARWCPLEIFPEPAHTLAYLTPQAWAIQGLRDHGRAVPEWPPVGECRVTACALCALSPVSRESDQCGQEPGHPVEADRHHRPARC